MSMTKRDSPTGVGTERDYGDPPWVQEKICTIENGCIVMPEFSVQERREVDAWDLQREIRNFDDRYGRESLLTEIFRYMAGKC